MLTGIDVSSFQGLPDWTKVKAAGVSFAWAKATEGISFTENPPTFDYNRKNAAWNGIALGAYHFARPELGNDPVKEATYFCDRVKSVQANELRPVLDIETGAPSTAWVLAWLRETERRLGVRPIFYTYLSFLDKFTDELKANWSFWLAYYGPKDDLVYELAPDTGYRMVAQQWTSVGSVDGISGNIDMNYAASLDDLRESGDYRLWRTWKLAGSPSPRPSGIPSTRPRWEQALAPDVAAIEDYCAAKAAVLEAHINDLTANLLLDETKIAKAKEALA